MNLPPPHHQDDSAPARPLRVIVADDHHAMRWAICQLLEASDCDVVAEAVDGPTAVLAAERHPADVLVVDLRMPGFDGMEVARRVRALHPDVRVVLFTAAVVEGRRLLAIEPGAGLSAVVSKSAMPQALVTAVRGGRPPATAPATDTGTAAAS